MAISRISSATGTTTATLGTHAAGDLILVFAYRDGNTTAPSIPGDFTNIQASGSNTNSARMGWKIAASGSETVGTWTNATSVIAVVYRGTDGVGGSAITGGSSTTIAYPALTMQVTDGSSWIVGAAGHRSTNVAIETAPSGMSNVTSVSDATDEAALHDTNSGVSSWSGANASVGGTASGYRSITVELLDAVAPTLTSATVDLVSSTSGAPKVTTNKASGTLYMVCVPDGDSPSVSQIKAGQNSSGGSAINAQNISVSSTGEKTFSTVTGLTTDTPYDFWFVHTNSVGDSSAVKADFTPVEITGDYGNEWISPVSVTTAAFGAAWSGTGNLATSDNTYVTSSPGAFTFTDYLIFDYQTDIAVDATITGISVDIEGFYTGSAPDSASSFMYFSSTGDTVGIEGSDTKFPVFSTTEQVTTYGGSSDDWSISLTPAFVNGAGFRLVMSLFAGSSGTTFNIDRVRLQIHTTGAPGPGIEQSSTTLFWSFP